MMIGLVPQELSVDMFETVLATTRYFGHVGYDEYVEEILRDLSLWDNHNSKIMELSGRMKRRVLIAKALSHQPNILFLDEPTAGVDVSLRRDMWKLVKKLRERGTTIILTTHYIEEAEEMADRVSVINKGELMKKLDQREMDIALVELMTAIPGAVGMAPDAGGRGQAAVCVRCAGGSAPVSSSRILIRRSRAWRTSSSTLSNTKIRRRWRHEGVQPSWRLGDLSL